MNIQIAQVIETEIGYASNTDEETGNDLFPGTIKVRFSSRQQNTTYERYASPLDPNNYKRPLVGEKVVLYTVPSDLRTSFRKKSRYCYGQIINIHDNLNTNVLPFENVNQAGGDDGADPAGGIQGEPLADDQIAQIDHEEKEIPPLQAYDGDMLKQDRYGNAFRMSTTAVGNAYEQSTQPWKGTPGDPIMILTSGLNTNAGTLFTIEDYAQDKSSIILASNQTLTFDSSQPKFGPPAKAIATSGAFSGAQVVINSDRLLFNSKTDSILLSGATTVAISTPAWAVDMDEFFTLFDNLLTTLQKVFAGASPFPTPVGGPTLPNAGALNEVIQIITKYKQMTQ